MATKTIKACTFFGSALPNAGSREAASKTVACSTRSPIYYASLAGRFDMCSPKASKTTYLSVENRAIELAGECEEPIATGLAKARFQWGPN